MTSEQAAHQIDYTLDLVLQHLVVLEQNQPASLMIWRWSS
jgi:hypothetical protein